MQLAYAVKYHVGLKNNATLHLLTRENIHFILLKNNASLKTLNIIAFYIGKEKEKNIENKKIT